MSKNDKYTIKNNKTPEQAKIDSVTESQESWKERKRLEAAQGLNHARTGPTKLTLIRRATKKHKGKDMNNGD